MTRRAERLARAAASKVKALKMLDQLEARIERSTEVLTWQADVVSLGLGSTSVTVQFTLRDAAALEKAWTT
jgi:hypothetical protein